MHMSGESLLVVLVVGLIAGWLTGQIVQGTGFGIVGDLLIGIAGAFIGSWLLPQLGLYLGSDIVLAVTNATIGALLLLLVIRLVRGGGRWHRGWAEIVKEEVGEDVGSRWLAGAESREPFGGQTWKRRLARPRQGLVLQLGPAISL